MGSWEGGIGKSEFGMGNEGIGLGVKRSWEGGRLKEGKIEGEKIRRVEDK